MAATSTEPRAAAALRHFLSEQEERFDRARHLIHQPFSSPGYHTTLKGGMVHPTRYSLQYAFALLESGEPEQVRRAVGVVDAVLALQDTDPLNATFGIWPWFAEEPLTQMRPPDWNWADFLGAMLAQALIEHRELLPDDLAARMRGALTNAALAIFRRNSPVSYTNIAVMGAGVTALAGEVLERPEFLDYGRAKLRAILRHVEETGGIAEYNSPTYSLVAVDELDRVLRFVRDDAAREAAEALHQHVWTMIAEHFHAPTQQWAGPHARAYSDRLTPVQVAHLAAATAAPIHVRVERDSAAYLDPPPPRWSVVKARPCPAELKRHFVAAPDEPRQITRVFGREAAGDIVGSTWFAPDACLGSVNRASYWNQHRTLIGYWRTPRDPAVMFRSRFLKDGRDFASMGVRQAQAGPRVLAATFPVVGAGDFHPTLDRPADGRFLAKDLRWRFELQGVDAAVEQPDPTTFVLRSGDRRVVIHALSGTFDGRPVRWETGGDAAAATVWIDAVCLAADQPHPIMPSELKQHLAAGIELLALDQSAAAAPELGPTNANWPDAGLTLPLPSSE